jgi:hypothetical protein
VLSDPLIHTRLQPGVSWHMNGNRFNGFLDAQTSQRKDSFTHVNSLLLTNLVTSHLGNVIEGANDEKGGSRASLTVSNGVFS